MSNPIVIEDIERIHQAIPDPQRFNGATILITGCAGFLGYYFAQYFVRYAARLKIRKVIGLDTFLLDQPEWLAALAREFPDVLAVRRFDVAKDDIAAIEGALDANYVIHGASIASPTFYRKYPLETIDANIWGLRHLLDAFSARDTLKGFLFFSSSEIYGDPDPAFIPTAEDYRGNVACVGPRACYDESKRFGETLCYVFASKQDMPITIARPFNNYGPGMRLGDRRLPADFARCIVNGEDIVILSDGTPTRTFCYISDAIAGYLLCLLHGKFDSFNIGVEKPEIMVRDLAQIYQHAGAEIFGYQGKVEYQRSDDAEYMTDNPNRRCPIIDKARKTLGYDPKVLVDEGVRRYLRFLKHSVPV
ncbi:MAG: NAD-dependent epimerase/dehydratase family protein [Nevskiaceae bacterium]|jgi:UDP-glucuronate decarboxylase|nr:NAD-dependent epimerase/dehydratase family protein [Nevskiaceae bacterium]